MNGDGWVVHHGSCLDVLPTLPNESVDAVVTDPPYELGFMGKSWDSSGIAFNTEVWAECLRVLKPGGHLLAFGGSRTWHRIAVAIEDAGFEVRDSIAWLYGSGFPKSLDISKAIDKAAGAEREVVTETVVDIFGVREERKEKPAFGIGQNGDAFGGHAEGAMFRQLGNPVTTEAQKWAGWGTALKPAFEPVIVARKPLIGTVAANVLAYGTGGLNIDGSRIGTESTLRLSNSGTNGDGWGMGKSENINGSAQGRWPANVMLDEFTADLLDEQSGISKSSRNFLTSKPGTIFGGGKGLPAHSGEYGFDDAGGASRFFYVAKASKRDRNEGLDGLEEKVWEESRKPENVGSNTPQNRSTKPRQNFHPTVKPTDLMRYLVKLVTPPGGTVLDPFTGSGSTGKATILEGFNFIGIELTEDYLPIIEGRLNHAVITRQQQQTEQAAKEAEALF